MLGWFLSAVKSDNGGSVESVAILASTSFVAGVIIGAKVVVVIIETAPSGQQTSWKIDSVPDFYSSTNFFKGVAYIHLIHIYAHWFVFWH